MNAITSFGLCTLSNEELLEAVDSRCDEMYQKGMIPDRHIPARPNEDFDILVGELILRFSEITKKEDKTKIKNIIKLEVGKSYLNREGEVVKIVGKKDPLYIYYPYISDIGTDPFMHDGFHFFSDLGEYCEHYQRNGGYLLEVEHPNDLIEEVEPQ